MAAFNEISPANLMRLIGTPTCPAIVDVSVDEDFCEDPHLIPTAFRHAHRDLEALVARLSRPGVQAQVVAGGNQAWRDAGLPRVPADIIPAPLWITRHRLKIDRIACPWLIRRFVDPEGKSNDR